MKIRFLRVLCVAIGFCAVAPNLDSQSAANSEAARTAAIRAVLADQQSAWNRGDVEGFMQGYWHSAELTFLGSSGVTRGWEPVLARYRKNYPDRTAMGHLDFSNIELRLLGSDAALVLGRWHLQRSHDQPGGVFTLVFQRFADGWRIIHDHTSADNQY
jgi:uncharacterized protein (TIGR02246 family)